MININQSGLLRNGVHGGIDTCPLSEFHNAAAALHHELLDLVPTGRKRPYTPCEER